jgi:hypothetical protein
MSLIAADAAVEPVYLETQPVQGDSEAKRRSLVVLLMVDNTYYPSVTSSVNLLRPNSIDCAGICR